MYMNTEKAQNFPGFDLLFHIINEKLELENR